jgi:hypothetical protein
MSLVEGRKHGCDREEPHQYITRFATLQGFAPVFCMDFRERSPRKSTQNFRIWFSEMSHTTRDLAR